MGFNVFQWIVVGTLLIQAEDYTGDVSAAVWMASMGLVLTFLFLVVGKRFKSVHVDDQRVLVAEHPLNVQFAWCEVQSVKMVPLVNIFSLRIVGRKNRIFFIPLKQNIPDIKLLRSYISKRSRGLLTEEEKSTQSQAETEEYSRVAI